MHKEVIMCRITLVILFIYILVPFSICAQQVERKEGKIEFVMILSSYSYEKEWSTTLAKEIRNQLENKKPALEVNITYANLEGYTSFLANRFAMQGAFANGRLSQKIIHPDVLVLIGGSHLVPFCARIILAFKY